MLYKVSIIIPAYNASKTIRQCLDALINQNTKHSFEIIVVLREGKDNTISILDEYKTKYPFIKYAILSDGYIPKSRVEGARLSNGEYIMFCDVDDTFSEDAIETMVNEIENSHVDIVSASYNEVYKNKTKKGLFRINKTLDQKGVIKGLMKDTYLRSFCWNKIYKASLFKDYKYYYPNQNFVRDDTLLNLQVYLHVNKLKIIKKPIYYYDKRFESTTNNIDKSRFTWLLNIFALERYYLKKNKPEYLSLFFKLKLRRKIITFIEKCIVKNYYTKDEFKTLKTEGRNYLKIINKKGELEINNTPWEYLIKDIENAD